MASEERSSIGSPGSEAGTDHASGTGPALSQSDLLGILNRQTDAANALVVSGLIEDWLEKLLRAAGRPLKDKELGPIFGRTGPLNNFAGKIEIAYLFKLIDKKVHDDLMRIKKIRNSFAHTTNYVYFDSDHIINQCKQFSNWKAGADPQTSYRDAALECINAIKGEIDKLMLINALLTAPSVPLDLDD